MTVHLGRLAPDAFCGGVASPSIYLSGRPAIITSYQDIGIPLVANGISRNSPSQLAMGFWYGGNSTITIDHITFQ